jgi:hypothetical protein
MQRHVAERLRTCRAELGEVPIEPLLSELKALGADVATALRRKQEAAAKSVDAARERLMVVRTAHGITAERLRSSKATLDAASSARILALPPAASNRNTPPRRWRSMRRPLTGATRRIS